MLQMVRETAAIKIHYIRQREMKGLGDAILCAKAFMGGEIQLTDALRVLAHREPVYAYDFEGTRYDVGDKLGFLKATVEYALRRPDLGEPFKHYLQNLFSDV